MVYTGWGQSNSPGNEQLDFWGSKAADRELSRNYAGIKDPAVDEIINRIIFAKDRDDQVAAVHALDRVLMAQQYVIPSYTASPTASPTGTASAIPTSSAEVRHRLPDGVVVGRGQGGQDRRRPVRRAAARPDPPRGTAPAPARRSPRRSSRHGHGRAGKTGLHGLSVFGELKYPADFKHFDYVDPDAPKGGRMNFQPPNWATSTSRRRPSTRSTRSCSRATRRRAWSCASTR